MRRFPRRASAARIPPQRASGSNDAADDRRPRLPITATPHDQGRRASHRLRSDGVSLPGDSVLLCRRGCSRALAHRLGLSAAAWILEQSGMVSADPVTIAGPDPASCLAALQSSLQGLQRINVLLVSAVLEVTPGPLDAVFGRAGARSTVEVLQVWIASPMNRLKIIDPRT